MLYLNAPGEAFGNHHSRRASTRQQLKSTQGLNQMLKKPLKNRTFERSPALKIHQLP